MKKYTITKQGAFIPAGTVIGLSEDQASKRQGLLEKKKKDVYLVLQNIQFKAGEEVKLEDPSKSLLEFLAPHLTKAEMDKLSKESKDKAGLKEANAKIKDLEAAATEAEQKIEELTTENQKLADANAQLSGEVEAVSKDLDDVSKERDALKTSNEELAGKVSDLEKQLDEATAPDPNPAPEAGQDEAEDKKKA